MKFLQCTAAATLIALLAGCATGPQGPTHNDILQSIGTMYVGKHVREVAGRYGVPQEQTEFSGQRIYLWHKSNQKTWTRPVESVTSGSIGESGPFGAAVPYIQRTSSQQSDTHSYQCTLEIYVDSNDVVRNVGMGGQMGACELFNPYR